MKNILESTKIRWELRIKKAKTDQRKVLSRIVNSYVKMASPNPVNPTRFRSIGKRFYSRNLKPCPAINDTVYSSSRRLESAKTVRV